MNRKIAVIIALQALLIIMMFWVIVFYGKDEYEQYTQSQDEQIETPDRISIEQGVTVVSVSAQAQAQSDIRTQILVPSSMSATLQAYGNVLSIDSLIEARSRYLAAMAEAEVSRASLNSSKQEYQRMQQLNQDDHNISDRAVIAAEAAYKSDQAKLHAAEVLAQNIRDSIRQTWGDTLAKQATLSQANAYMQQLLSYKQVLVQITLPFDSANNQAPSSLMLTPIGTQAQQLSASLISASPQTDNAVLGKTYFYHASAESLRTGMRLSVSINSNSKQSTGLIVPNSAVVWYAGKAWAYKKQGVDKFLRIPVQTTQDSKEGWFNPQLQAKAGDEIVTSGAQLLLSEEFKYQIKNENDD
jgi:membrane fusion protein, multidrug efflux system